MDILPEEVFGKILSMMLGATGVVFLLVSIALIYHWHYYGIGLAKRLFIIVLFLGVAFVLYMISWGLAIEYL